MRAPLSKSVLRKRVRVREAKRKREAEREARNKEALNKEGVLLRLSMCFPETWTKAHAKKKKRSSSSRERGTTKWSTSSKK